MNNIVLCAGLDSNSVFVYADSVGNNVDASLEEAKRAMYLLELELGRRTEPPIIVEIKAGFNYWRDKFDRLLDCKLIGDLAILVEEPMFTDEKDKRETYTYSSYKTIQIAMKIFVNAARNKVMEIPIFYADPKRAVMEVMGIRDKFLIMNGICDDICRKNGYKSMGEYCQTLDK